MGKLLKNGSPARKNKLTTAVGSSGKKTIKTKASSSQGSATPKLNMLTLEQAGGAGCGRDHGNAALFIKFYD